MNNRNVQGKAKREYKDSLFRMIFNDERKLLNLYEHQSTYNPNMPLRDLLYVAREYERLIADKSLYASALVKIPTEEPALELKVRMLNINSGMNVKILSQCQLLTQYMQYVDKVRQYASKMDLDEAVENAVTECIQEGILVEFLTRYRAEAVSVSIFEYNEEKEMALIRQAEFDEGIKEGIKEGQLRFLVKMICRKLEKGKEPEMIIAELEEDAELIREVYQVARKYAPNYDSDEIYKCLVEKNKCK